jgi:hypothetical protein
MVARTYTSLPQIIDIWFQFLFHSPPGVLFTFPSRYLFTIGHQVVFSLIQWSGLILTEFHVLRDTWDIYLAIHRSSSTRLSLSMAALSRAVLLTYVITSRNLYLPDIYSRYPHITTHTSFSMTWVWAFPISLTTTTGIIFILFSWHYLDVSVHAVRLFTLYIQIKISWDCQEGFPHSEIFGSKLICQLPEAYRRL